jgi:hypothetical protein
MKVGIVYNENRTVSVDEKEEKFEILPDWKRVNTIEYLKIYINKSYLYRSLSLNISYYIKALIRLL